MRSYAVYNYYSPILSAVPDVVLLLVAAPVAIVGIVVLSEAIHRWIEMPAINFARTQSVLWSSNRSWL